MIDSGYNSGKFNISKHTIHTQTYNLLEPSIARRRVQKNTSFALPVEIYVWSISFEQSCCIVIIILGHFPFLNRDSGIFSFGSFDVAVKSVLPQ